MDNNFNNRGFGSASSTDNSQFGSYSSEKTETVHTVKVKLPNSQSALTLGILSIVTLCCCGPFIGPILAIIALVMIPKSIKIYKSNPDIYTHSSFQNLKAARVCAIIGLSLGVIFMLIAMGNIIFNISSDFWEQAGNIWNQMTY